MSKQVPSDYVIIHIHEGYILHLYLLLVLTYNPMQTYPPEGWKILSHAILVQNMDCNTSVLNFNEAEYAEYYQWLEEFFNGMVLHNMLYTP